MCGRYASSRKPEDLVEEFEIRTSRVKRALEPDFNVAPTKEVYAVVERPPSTEEDPERQLRVLNWGLVPSWAKDPGIGSRLINARLETVAEKPAFRRAFAARRCLLPADGYYEWYVTSQPDAKGRPVKQPYFITPEGGGVLAMAGLYEIWRDPDRAADDPDRFRWTSTVITTSAADDLGRIHDRMPLMVPRAEWGRWLDPRVAGPDLRDLRDVLRPAVPGLLRAYPVTTLVNNVRNNGPELVAALPVS